LEGLALEDVGIFNGHLVHFTVFGYILWAFGIVRGNLVYFFPFWYFVQRKIWQPWCVGKVVVSAAYLLLCKVKSSLVRPCELFLLK
jgi:hypothetical protein